MDFAMGAMGLGFILTLRDEVSNNLDKIRNKLLSFKDTTQEVLDKFDTGVRNMMGGFSTMYVGKRVLGFFDGMIGGSVRGAASFEQAMAGVRAVANTTDATFKQLENKALELGRTTQFTAMDAANAIETVIRAGQSPEQALKSVDSVLQLAAADGLTLAESATFISQAMNTFEKEAKDAAAIANLYAQASRSSSLNSRTLGEAMSYAGGIAHSMGMSIEETTAYLAALSDAGFTGSRGGTIFRNILPNLVEQKTIDKLKAEGIQTVNKLGQTLSPAELLENIGKHFKSGDEARAVQFVKNVFGKIAQGGASALANAAKNGKLQEAFAKMFNTGTAAEDMKQVMEDTLEGAQRSLASATEGLNIAIGQLFTGTYTQLIRMIANLKNLLTSFIKQHPIIVKMIAGAVGALTILTGVLLTLWGVFKMYAGIRQMWTGIRLVIVNALSSIQGAALPVVGVISGLIALAGVLYAAYQKNWGGFRNFLQPFIQGFELFEKANEKGEFQLTKDEADKMRADGVFEPAFKVARVLWRVQKFFEGFVEGFTGGFKLIGDAIQKVLDFFFGFEEAIEKVAVKFGLLDGSIGTASEAWKKWGEVIGYVVSGITSVVIALKTVSAVSAIGHLAAAALNPWIAGLLVILGILGLIIANWEKIDAAWNADKKIANSVVESLNKDNTSSSAYIAAEFKKQGYGFDEQGNIKDDSWVRWNALPPDVLEAAQNAYKRAIAREAGINLANEVREQPQKDNALYPRPDNLTEASAGLGNNLAMQELANEYIKAMQEGRPISFGDIASRVPEIIPVQITQATDLKGDRNIFVETLQAQPVNIPDVKASFSREALSEFDANIAKPKEGFELPTGRLADAFNIPEQPNITLPENKPVDVNLNTPEQPTIQLASPTAEQPVIQVTTLPIEPNVYDFGQAARFNEKLNAQPQVQNPWVYSTDGLFAENAALALTELNTNLSAFVSEFRAIDFNKTAPDIEFT
ncbi:MAG: phage tail tape measure protein, partial [Synergistaceae bacterium]|nr:phage tail tape measure protein [Synergistaceae bacterium]